LPRRPVKSGYNRRENTAKGESQEVLVGHKKRKKNYFVEQFESSQNKCPGAKGSPDSQAQMQTWPGEALNDHYKKTPE